MAIECIGCVNRIGKYDNQKISLILDVSKETLKILKDLEGEFLFITLEKDKQKYLSELGDLKNDKRKV